MKEVFIPLIIRGRLIESDPIAFETRRGELTLRTPDVKRHLQQLVLRNPAELRDLYGLSLNDIIDYFVALGPRLDSKVNPHIEQAMVMARDTTNQSAAMLAHLYQSMTRIFTRDYIEEYLAHSIGREYLEGWVPHVMSDRVVNLRAFGGRAVHVIAGNSPLIALLTFLMNGLSRSDAIIKVPSNDPCFAPAVARTMAEMAPEHPITRHVSVAYWKGGDAEVERPLYNPLNLEKIAAWGGFASMGSIRQYLGPGLDLVALDPKLSASIVGADTFKSEVAVQDAAVRAAADIAYANQGACVSARILYIESGTDAVGIDRANDFGKRVFEAIQALPAHRSSPHPAFDPVLRSEIDGIRYSDEFRVFGGKGSEGAVIVSQGDVPVDFAGRLDCRVANLVPVDSIAAALERITVHTQTIGVYPEELKAQIRDECAWRGGQRITTLGNAMAGNLIGPHDAIEPMRRLVRWIKEDRLHGRTGLSG
jgi:hypothetical protein